MGKLVIVHNDIRIGLLRSIDDAMALLEKLQAGVKASDQVNVALCTSAQREIVRLSSAISEHHIRIKNAADFVEMPEQSQTPDYAHWARLSWTIYDAAALAAGRDPEAVDWSEATPLLEWLQSAVQTGQLKQPISPAAFLQWFDKLGDENLMLPPKMRQAVANHESIYAGDERLRALETSGSNRSASAAPLPSETNDDVTEDGKGRLRATPRTFRTAQQLLTYFMDSGGLIDLAAKEMPSVSYSTAEEIAANIKPRPLDPKTVRRHFMDALITVWEKR